MKKIDKKAWEEAKESIGFKRLAPGGYVCAIKNVEDVPEKEYLKVQFDVVKGDDAGYFTRQFKADNREEKKWPNAGTFYRSYKDSALGMFKGFITSVSESNKNFKWDWDEQVLKNKYIGVIISEEEYLNGKGEKRVRNHVVNVRSVPTIESGDFDIPELKKLDTSAVQTNTKEDNFVDPFGSNNENDDTDTNVVSNDDVGDAPFDDDDNPFANLD